MDSGPHESRGQEASGSLIAYIYEGEVYPPSEDTFFLADYLEQLGPIDVVLEVGFGNGYLTRLLAKKADYVVGSDISLRAAMNLIKRLREESIGNVDILVSDSVSVFRKKCFELIVSNPPYLPCDYEKEPMWCGGANGIEFSLRLARESMEHLMKNGSLVFLVSSLSNFRILIQELKKFYKRLLVVKTKHISLFEKLFIIQCVR
ncbi:methyltransferase [Infirmifilum uzonense]|mgnify:CR=1 FL=1|jgi:release factor glutamine methyltransferase|uniref:methyltransferase n=1 Tax=Infirmifilum TaxID=2856573 RepID=UPI0023534403